MIRETFEIIRDVFAITFFTAVLLVAVFVAIGFRDGIIQ